MSAYVQYHNCRANGLPLGDPCDDLGIHTRLGHVRGAEGGQVFLIAGIGKPRLYYLWYAFTIERIKRRLTMFHARVPGWYLPPPAMATAPPGVMFALCKAFLQPLFALRKTL